MAKNNQIEEGQNEVSAAREITFPPRRVLSPIDGSENASRALRVAIEISKKNDAQLYIITVTPRDNLTLGLATDFPIPSTLLDEYYDQLDKRSDRILENTVFLARKEGVKEVKGEAIPEFDSVIKQILEQASSKKIDLIVIGTRGLGGFRRLLLGSVSNGVVTHANCNVLIVR